MVHLVGFYYKKEQLYWVKSSDQSQHRCNTVIVYYKLQHVSAVQISHHQVDVGYTKMNMKGERPFFTVS